MECIEKAMLSVKGVLEGVSGIGSPAEQTLIQEILIFLDLLEGLEMIRDASPERQDPARDIFSRVMDAIRADEKVEDCMNRLFSSEKQLALLRILTLIHRDPLCDDDGWQME